MNITFSNKNVRVLLQDEGKSRNQQRLHHVTKFRADLLVFSPVSSLRLRPPLRCFELCVIKI